MPPLPETEQDGLRNRKVVSSKDKELRTPKSFTWAEVAKHNTSDSCWVTIHGKVYDITKWLNRHPGGKEVLLLTAGRDISIAFESYHPFTNKAHDLLHKFEIGVVLDTEFPPYRVDTEFYGDIRQSVNKYFVDNKLDHKNPIYGLWRMAIVMPLALILSYYAYGPTDISFSVRLVFAIVFGIFQALPLLHVMHDCSHMAFGHSERWWMFWGRLFMDWYVGCSMTSWHNQHTIGHHIYTNIFKADPDCPVAEKDGDLRRIVKRQAWAYTSQFQYIYLPIMYGFLGMLMRYADITEVFTAMKNGPVRVNPHGFLGHLEHILSKLFFCFWRIYLPLSYGMPLSTFLPLFAATELMTGYWLAWNFQVSHISDVADFPLSEKEEKTIDQEWAVAQTVSSVNYSLGNWFTTFCCGALNYQIEHHLLPTVSQYHYPAIAPIVKEICRKHGVRYNELPNYYSAFYHHVKHLYNMGQKGEVAELHLG
mmetsp:Transcript_5546/g.5727  ORF Transcript_5546/g.5727 Transcript_5546/m.5727 type:complete len:478 (+) Transcript_5546:79-1512(+)|eukprot:CAMPEP_0182418190 /NCGR_PEP_ID=MMETSP1167-20130531/2663_1 /TAXON_ID=2988 /ORGANISM="Mallomonas Sp, Strain CCMP3275" /LENGTH=477 /DNA_ID=CAMNT_0024592259 /DNA_START=78 /DNA_END=1511 /DNA_ORIENTATION=+